MGMAPSTGLLEADRAVLGPSNPIGYPVRLDAIVSFGRLRDRGLCAWSFHLRPSSALGVAHLPLTYHLDDGVERGKRGGVVPLVACFDV